LEESNSADSMGGNQKIRYEVLPIYILLSLTYNSLPTPTATNTALHSCQH